jgi:hypothetical protein
MRCRSTGLSVGLTSSLVSLSTVCNPGDELKVCRRRGKRFRDVRGELRDGADVYSCVGVDYVEMGKI